MIIDVVIPTKWRPEKLDRCVKSVLDASIPTTRIFLYVTENSELIEYTLKYKDEENIFVGFHAFDTIARCWNEHIAVSVDADAYIFLSDDTELQNSCIENALQMMESAFPGYSGVVGLNVTNMPEHVEWAYVLLGRGFCEEFFLYGGHVPYCPEYFRIGLDWEMGVFAQSKNRYRFCPAAQMKHYHPQSQDDPGQDETHRDSRSRFGARDQETLRRRKQLGFVWGECFDLIKNMK